MCVLVAEWSKVQVNKSLFNGIFPDKLEIAKIVSIFKSNDKLLINNYCPISVLPFLWKILEKLMYNRLLHYLNVNNILIDNQYGFWKGHSTSMALIQTK